MKVKQKLAAEPAIEGIPSRSQIAPFNRTSKTVIRGWGCFCVGCRRHRRGVRYWQLVGVNFWEMWGIRGGEVNGGKIVFSWPNFFSRHNFTRNKCQNHGLTNGSYSDASSSHLGFLKLYKRHQGLLRRCEINIHCHFLRSSNYAQTGIRQGWEM